MGEKLIFGLVLAAIGMGVVFLALLLLNLFIQLMGWIEGSVQGLAKRRGSREAVPPSVPDTIPELSEEEIAVIAAAAEQAIAEPVRIHRIRLVSEEEGVWSRIGRLDIMRSHDPGRAQASE